MVVILGLIQLSAQIGHSIGATDCLITAEKSLSVFLKRNGLRFKPIGPEVDYHGKRSAYILPAKEGFSVMMGYRAKIQTALHRARPTVPRTPHQVLAQSESFDLAGFRFTVADEDTVWDHLSHLWREDDGGVPDSQDPFAIALGAFDTAESPAGTIRMTLNSPYGLPLLALADRVHRPVLEGSRKVAELSVLSLSKHYMAWWDSFRAGGCDPAPGSRRRLLLLLLGLLRMVYRVSKHLRVTTWLVLLDTATTRTLNAHGVMAVPIGPVCDSQGRAPHKIRLKEVEPALLNPALVKKLCSALIARNSCQTRPLQDILRDLSDTIPAVR
jgi:hypothetical protein